MELLLVMILIFVDAMLKLMVSWLKKNFQLLIEMWEAPIRNSIAFVKVGKLICNLLLNVHVKAPTVLIIHIQKPVISQLPKLFEFIIQISYTVRILMFWLVDLYHLTLGCDKTTFFMSLSWCNSHGVNSIHHCHYTMALADSKFDNFFCCVFNLNNQNVNALIARELLEFTCTRSLTMNSKFSIQHSEASCSIEIPRSLLVNSCR